MRKPTPPKPLDADGHHWETITKTFVPATFVVGIDPHGNPSTGQRPTPMGLAGRRYKVLWCVRCGCLQFTEADRGFNREKLGATRREYRTVGSGDTMLMRPRCVPEGEQDG